MESVNDNVPLKAAPVIYQTLWCFCTIMICSDFCINYYYRHRYTAVCKAQLKSFSRAFCGSSVSFLFEADSVDVLHGDVNKYICSSRSIPLIIEHSPSCVHVCWLFIALCARFYCRCTYVGGILIFVVEAWWHERYVVHWDLVMS